MSADDGRVQHPLRRGHIIDLLRRRMGPHHIIDAEPDGSEDRVTVHRADLRTVLAFVKNDPDANLKMLVDLTCIDRHDGDAAPDGGARYQVVLRLRSRRLPYRLMLTVGVPADDPVIPSVTPILPAADWYERELWDLFGIYADGHPYLRRLLLYPGFSGHPMRRDYPRHKEQPLVPLREPKRAPVIVTPPAPEARGEEGA